MSKTHDFDVVVIGGGPGGYVCAIRAAQLGLKTAVIEKDNLGGICLNWGCIPTKALLKASELYKGIKKAEAFGISASVDKVDVKKLIGRSRDVSGNLVSGIGFLMKKNNVTVINGTATFRDANFVEVQTNEGVEIVSFKNAVIATGARPRQIPNVLEADGKNIWTYFEALAPEKMPKKMLVIGAGAIGVEFSNFYNTFGVEVDLVEGMDRILPVEDAEISKIAEKSLSADGMNIMTKAKVLSLNATKTGVEAEIEHKGKTSKKKYDKALLAIGVQANVENLGLERLDVRLENGMIAVDDAYATNVEGIYAIGDVIGKQQLAHVASHEGIICAEALAGKPVHAMNYSNVPSCTYCTPQVASVGLTEESAKAAGHDMRIGRFAYQANGKAQAIGAETGLVKTIFDKNSGELLGAHIVGADATEMISTFLMARHLEATELDMVEACLPHPTLSEMMGESILDSLDRVIHA